MWVQHRHDGMQCADCFNAFNMSLHSHFSLAITVHTMSASDWPPNQGRSIHKLLLVCCLEYVISSMPTANRFFMGRVSGAASPRKNNLHLVTLCKGD